MIFRLLFLFFIVNNFLLAEGTIKSLSDKYPKSAKINLRILKENELLAGEDCKLTITCKDIKEEIKSYSQIIQSGDFIRIPEGNWDFELFYKYGFSTYQATFRIKNKKTFDIEINIDPWMNIDKNGLIVGKIFDKKQTSADLSQRKAEDLELARLGFYGLPLKGSFAPIEKTFLVNWLINKPFGGRVWFCSRLPFFIDENNDEFYNHQVLSKIDQEKTLSFYYHPGDTKVQYSLYMKSMSAQSIQDFYKKNDKYFPYLATSIVFDTIAGPLYSGLDIDFTSENDLRVWFCLLNQGYQMPAVSSDYLTATDFDNSWLFLPLKDASTLAEKFKALKTGTATMSNGPSLMFRIDEVLPGGFLIADNKNHQLTVQARVDPNTGDIVESFEIIRNGVLYKKIKPETVNNIFQVHFYHVFEKSYAWYVVRTNTKAGKSAITNPIYFLPEGYLPPSPVVTLLKITTKDEDGASIVGANIKIMTGKKIYHEGVIDKDTFELQVPLFAEIFINKEGYKEDHFLISENKKVLQLMMELSVPENGGAAALADPAIYKKLREDLIITIQHRVLKSLVK